MSPLSREADFTLLVTRISPAGPGRRRATLGGFRRSSVPSRGVGSLGAPPGVVDSTWRGRVWVCPRPTDSQSGYLSRSPLGGRGEHVARGLTSAGVPTAPVPPWLNPPFFYYCRKLLRERLASPRGAAGPWSPVGVVAPAECPNLLASA